ncbi:hypothetical protein SAY87_003928 [Trapa incisa]|uniref:DNA annealing helicase and endonuclease ZRANB3 n=1 Tax=Trapa incisa TaxID=236973 RepID=A0AAN7JN16_9MYRT|nr:hypothetical protein SAY87_003928 [Trapa incisa]
MEELDSDITEEQRLRAEANRLAALAKRRAATGDVPGPPRPQDPWRLFKCRKISANRVDKTSPGTGLTVQARCPSGSLESWLTERFRIRLEVCSPDSFSATPEPVKGFQFPGEEECLHRLDDFLADVMPTHYTQALAGGKAGVYKLRDYDAVLRCLRNVKSVDYEEIPWGTYNVIEKLSHSYVEGRWIPCRPEHLPSETVDELIKMLPKKILGALMPFQLDGVRFGLQRGGRCLIADEMGLGKTLQAITIASCFMNKGSLLVVCPAILRFSWAEELERWLPCLPTDIHLVFGHQDNPLHLKKWPKIVVISYKMLLHLRNSMLEHEWAFLIVDESHHLRCSKKASEPEEIRAVLDAALKVKHVVLLSGTPSLSRLPFDIFNQIDILWPGLLGKNKFDFAKTYCAVKFGHDGTGKVFKDFSKGIRLDELNILLRQTVMIRRLKGHVLSHLPPKRRQIIRLLLKKSDIVSAKAALRACNVDDPICEGSCDATFQKSDQSDGNKDHVGLHDLSYQELGIAKLSGFCQWLSLHPLLAVSEDAFCSDMDLNPQKMIIFAHHHKVLDKVQEFICEKGVPFVRIDGKTLPRDRQSAVLSFQTSSEVKVAIIGITAGGVGLNLSSAKTVVFLELPPSSSWMLQAEDRAHRQGQINAINIYYFCAKDTMDDFHWQYLSRSLYWVSSTTNGKCGAIREIPVEDVSYWESSDCTDRCYIKTLEKIAVAELPVEPMEPSHTYSVDNFQSSDSQERTILQGNDCNDIENEGSRLSEQVENSDREVRCCLTGIMNDCAIADLDKVKYPILQDNQQPEVNESLASEFCDSEHCDSVKDEGSSILVNSLRFEVSQYTGRIHLYSCTHGTDSRPRPLFESFRPEELDLHDSLILIDKEDMKNSILQNNAAAFRQVAASFLSQWHKLRPIHRRKLLGKPLQLPLAIELCYLTEGANHDMKGILKNKSKRRTTPLVEISHPLPENATWKKVLLFNCNRKKAKEYVQGWSLEDEPLCKLCQLPCKGRKAREPEFFEDLFCNLACYEEYRLRTSGRFIRQELFEIEHGVCTNCQLDCHKLVKCLKPLSLERRREYIKKNAPKLIQRKKLFEKLVNDPSEGNAWHADHIVPVYEGGGECLLENMRTLCVACHSDVTAIQCGERRAQRKQTRRQLKAILASLKNNDNTKVSEANTMVSINANSEEVAVEDELLVTVPGSAYSVGN